MNIFYLDSIPEVCAKYHNDKHVVKMILEYCQLLSTAHRVLDGDESTQKSFTGRNVRRWVLPDDRETILYSATHMNHPSAIWCRQSGANYDWLHRLLRCLSQEYTYRYGKVHKCESTGLIQKLAIRPLNLQYGEFTQPTPAMPDDVKVAGDSMKSYRNYYISNKQHLASWQGKINSRKIPTWFELGSA